jgi:Fe-S cluster assembly protein SufB
VQNWYPGDKEGKGGIYNFVTKRGKCCKGRNSKISWTQVETGSAITWKYPSVHLAGRQFRRRILFRGPDQSLPAGRHRHQDDPHRQKHPQHHRFQGHLRRAGPEQLPRPGEGPQKRDQRAQLFPVRFLLLGDRCGAHTFPYIEVRNTTASVEHEASTSKIGEDQIFYCNQRGISTQDAVNMIVNGFCKEVFKQLPMEFAVEAQKLLGVSLEGSVG